jgi:hypothetical protein
VASRRVLRIIPAASWRASRPGCGTIQGVTQPFETPSQLPDDLAAATSVVVEAGDAFDTYPYTERPELLTIRDVEVVQQLLAELAAADLTPGVTLPVLCGLRLTFRDDAENHVGSVGVLTAGWLRNWWSSDALLPVGLSLLRDENSDLHQYLRTGWQAADAVTPAHAAARDSGGQEHAMGDTETLCGLPGASVEVYRHHFAFRADDCSDCYRLAWDRNDPPPWPKVYESAAALSIRWADRWGVTPPVGHMLRGRDTWVRFHSLPESKRYADTTEESDEILRRHHTLLNELAATTGSREVLVLTLSWSCSQQPVPQAAPLQAALPGSRTGRASRTPTTRRMTSGITSSSTDCRSRPLRSTRCCASSLTTAPRASSSATRT